MAQSDWIAGSEMTVTVATVAYPFRVVKWNPKAKMINRSNSKYTPGFEVKKAGIKTGTITAEGPYKVGEAPLSVGEEYVFVIKPHAAHLGFTVTALIEDLSFSDDVEDGPVLSMTAQTQASFDPAIV